MHHLISTTLCKKSLVLDLLIYHVLIQGFTIAPCHWNDIAIMDHAGIGIMVTLMMIMVMMVMMVIVHW